LILLILRIFTKKDSKKNDKGNFAGPFSTLPFSVYRRSAGETKGVIKKYVAISGIKKQ